jgi:hypothetical protein
MDLLPLCAYLAAIADFASELVVDPSRAAELGMDDRAERAAGGHAVPPLPRAAPPTTTRELAAAWKSSAAFA